MNTSTISKTGNGKKKFDDKNRIDILKVKNSEYRIKN
jgi:hypothetical protein